MSEGNLIRYFEVLYALIILNPLNEHIATNRSNGYLNQTPIVPFAWGAL
jgi:hypothetical protein